MSVRERERAARQAQRAAQRIASAETEAERTAHIYDLVRARIGAIKNRDQQDEAWRRLGEHLGKFR